MDGNIGVGAAQPFPAMRELLRQCVGETEADAACVALLNTTGGRRGVTLSIPSVYPTSERSARFITRWVRSGICKAIEQGRTEMIVGRFASPDHHRLQQMRVLIVAPMYTSAGIAWGAVAIVRQSSTIEKDAIESVEQCASSIAHVLTQSDEQDDEYADDLAEVEPPPQRTRVQSGPRDDFLLHELRVPLSAASYALDGLAKRYGAYWDESDARLLHTAQSGVSEAQRIVHLVSQWPALGTGMVMPDLQPVSVEETIERAITLLPAAYHRVVRRLDMQLPLVYGNATWITHVLMNLLENALKYSSEFRDVEISARKIDSQFVHVSVRSWSDETASSRDFFARPLDYRVPSNDLTSKGLGLNIARYFINSMGGEIWMDNNGADGVTISLVLPIAPVRSPALEPEPAGQF